MTGSNDAVIVIIILILIIVVACFGGIVRMGRLFVDAPICWDTLFINIAVVRKYNLTVKLGLDEVLAIHLGKDRPHVHAVGRRWHHAQFNVLNWSPC